MAPQTVSPRISLPFSCPHSPATSSSNLQAVKAQRVAPAFSHTNAFRSWGSKHYATKFCTIFVVLLPKPKAAYLPSKPLVLRPQLSGHSECALKPLSSALKLNLFSSGSAVQGWDKEPLPQLSQQAQWCTACQIASVDTPQQCGKCNKVKPATEYYRNGRRPIGLNKICKPCHLENHRVYVAMWKASEKVPRHEKLCTTCRQTKPVSEFSKNGRRSDGLKHQCKPCAIAYDKRWRRSKDIVNDASP
jgi:hypothetical protein